MGLFGNKEICTICKINESDKKLLDGWICKSCMKKCSPFIVLLSWKNVSSDQVIKAIGAAKKNNDLLKIFQPTKKIENYIAFDVNNRLWKLDTYNVVLSYEDIISYELIEDGDSVVKGGLGRAVSGGILFGTAGAVVGGITGKKKQKTEVKDLRLRIITRNELYPEVYVFFLRTGTVKAGSILYKSYKGAARQIIAELERIIDSIKNDVCKDNQSQADEIVKYKKLYDDGIITEEEFELKKKQLLGL